MAILLQGNVDTGFGCISGTKDGGGGLAEVLSKSGGTLRERGLLIDWVSPAGKKGGLNGAGIEGLTKVGGGDEAQKPLKMLSRSSS